MGVISKVMRQRAIYWPPGVPDNYGKIGYGSVEVVRCRWDDEYVEFMTPEGSKEISNASVMVSKAVALGGVLMLSPLPATASDEERLAAVEDLENPLNNAGAWKIRAYTENPNFRAREFLRIAIL